MSFSLFDIFLVTIVSQGVFLSVVLQLIPNRNKSANKILCIILVIASIVCLGRILAFKYESFLIIRIGTIVDGTIFLFGPLLYLYFRRLMFVEEDLYKLEFKHYIILCLFTIYAIWTFTLNKDGFAINYQNGVFQALFFLIELTGICSMLFYTYKIASLIQTYTKYERNQVAYNQSIVSYVKYIIIAVSIFISLWLFSFISWYFFKYYHPVFNYNVMWLSVAVFMFFNGYYSLAQPEIFRMPLKLIQIKKKSKERLSSEAIAKLKEHLNKVMMEEEIFLKPNLSLIMLSETVKTSSNNLSWYLNTIENKSFYQYINEYRVKAFIEKIQNKEHFTKTVLALAFEAGFNTKSTFNKSFRSIMNDTPANYIKKCLKYV